MLERNSHISIDANGVNLAGAKGSSKSWKLVNATGSLNGGATQPVTLDACFLDNLYTFSNNSAQVYQATEGATKCNPSDSTIVEEGSWAFTADAKSLLIDGNYYNSDGSLFTTLGQAVKIVQLTSTNLSLSFTVTNSQGTIVYTLNFAKN